ncbi:hypothetical protein B4N89_47310 [Embleya scabrispora]|uniref:Uncharacterized protein n=1 Tax=Embleya scabrispora TaxID=159449 RepID=A0A1T3NIL7_9ACTN|nr:hypothetical protein [Embleya scabrispora]OPC76421.1 hypothetical protein B4N89_47310 [Embleya scabrispora]
MGHFAATVADDHHSARGWMHGLAQFMTDRATPAPAVTVHSYTHVRNGRAPDHVRPVDRDITPLHTDANLMWALRMTLPDVVYTTDTDRDGVNAWIHDGVASWAVVTTLPDGGARTEQGGPRRLFDAFETAWDAWVAHGSVSRWDHGITLTEHEQYVWEGDPDTGRRHHLPTPAPAAHLNTRPRSRSVAARHPAHRRAAPRTAMAFTAMPAGPTAARTAGRSRSARRPSGPPQGYGSRQRSQWP